MTLLIFSAMMLLSSASALDLQPLRPMISATAPVDHPPPLQQSLPPPSQALYLCGNGVVNTIQDYKNLPLILQQQQEPVQIWADEECDDGNRLDFDGCSADCMHMDLWVSSCELQLPSNLVNMEAMLSLPDNKMLVSALDGLYVLKSEPDVGDTSVLLTSSVITKHFPVKDLFMDEVSGTVILYQSTPEQMLWKWAPSSGGISLLKTVSMQLSPWSSSAYYDTTDNVLIMHDEHTIVVYDIASNTINTTVCTVAQSLGPQWSYLGMQGPGQVILGDITTNSRIVVQFYPQKLCTSLPYPNAPQLQNDILSDAVTTIMPAMDLRSVDYDFKLPDGLPTLFPVAPFYLTAYSPMGIFMEIPVGSERNYWTQTLDLTQLSHYLGDRTLFDAFVMNNRTYCQTSAKCVLDIPVDSDFFALTPSTTVTTWQDVLQDTIRREAQGIATFHQLYANTTLYSHVLNAWLTTFVQRTAQKRMTDLVRHMSSNNLWVLKNDTIYEIAKSGAQIRLPNSNKCLPTNVRVCSSCYWGKAMEPCQPCSVQSSSLAWSIQCQGCQGRRRHLLSQNPTPLEFVLGAPTFQDVSYLQGLFQLYAPCIRNPSTTWGWDHGNAWVTVRAWPSDPVECTRELMPIILSNHLSIIVAPHVPLSMPLSNITSSQAKGTTATLSTGAIAGISCGIGFILLVGVIAAIYHFIPHGHLPQYQTVRS